MTRLLPYLALGVAGLLLGAVVNLLVERLGDETPPCSPWNPRSPRDAATSGLDRLPILGWFRLNRAPMRRELGSYFIVRPLLVELGAATLAPLVWAWVVDRVALVPPNFRPLDYPWPALAALLLVLLAVMLAATTIDFLERIIPDEITDFGALAALAFAVLLPSVALPAFDYDPVGAPKELAPLRFSSPHDVPLSLQGPAGLALALAIILGWRAAILAPPLCRRLPLRRALYLAVRRIVRNFLAFRYQQLYLLVALVPVVAAWALGGPHWESTLSATVGLAVGLGLTWTIRLVAAEALDKEGLGFGDVTLMAMIGAFLGWQPVVITFFVAPVAGLLLHATASLLSGDRALPYGPYLCLGAMITVAAWVPVWDYLYGLLWVGWLAPTFGLVLGPLTYLLLRLLRSVPYFASEKEPPPR